MSRKASFTLAQPPLPLSALPWMPLFHYDNNWDVVIHIIYYVMGTLGQVVLYKNRGHTEVVADCDVDSIGLPMNERLLKDIVCLLEAI